MGLKRVKRSKNKWFRVGDYWCPERNVMSSECVHHNDVKTGKVDIVNKIKLNKKCNGSGYISGKSALKGTPLKNEYYKPDVAGSWCWNKDNDYCKCDCSVYTDQQSCNSGYLESENNKYCWGCNWG